MFCANPLKDVVFLFALKAFQHISAENIHVVYPGCFVPKVFDLNRRLRLTLAP
jgi:hypothetical protein